MRFGSTIFSATFFLASSTAPVFAATHMILVGPSGTVGVFAADDDHSARRHHHVPQRCGNRARCRLRRWRDVQQRSGNARTLDVRHARVASRNVRIPLHRAWPSGIGHVRHTHRAGNARDAAEFRRRLNVLPRKRRCRREAGIVFLRQGKSLRGFLPLTQRSQSVLARTLRDDLLRIGEIGLHVFCPHFQRGLLHCASV